MIWDIFCKVIDNYGDIGVGWRLSADLAGRGEQVRLWVDDASALRWMAPDGCAGVEVRAWAEPLDLNNWTVGDALVGAFGCEVAPEIVASYALSMGVTGQKPVWINLEYLSAEPFVQRSHGLPSPVMSGPGAGLTKHFFYPGFTPGTGGLLREPGLLHRQAAFDRDAWLRQMGIAADGKRLVSLFCYEPAALDALLTQLASGAKPTRLLVTAGRAQMAVSTAIESKNRLQPSWNGLEALSISYLPTLAQMQFDELLWASDLNFVRGEDSLVRAIWAGKPLVWQIYPQHDDAHHTKLDAFLAATQAPHSLQRYTRTWNGVGAEGGVDALDMDFNLDPINPLWRAAALASRALLMQQTDLTSQLLAFRP